jgi:hypothetical protein
MILLSTVSLLAGLLLAQRFRVMVLIPASVIVVGLAVGTGATHVYTVWSIILITAMAATSLQIGYLIGIGVRHFVMAAVSNRTSALATTASPSAPHSAR